MAGKGDSKKTILYALGANFAIAVAKGVAAALTGSGAMLAETVHSLADCGNQGLLLLGMKQSKAPPSEEYPLGQGRAIYFWSFLVALMLFSVGGCFSIYEGLHKLHSNEPVGRWYWAAGVLVFSIIAESVSMKACLDEVKKARGDRSLWRWFRETRQVELAVIFGEDLAALLGLILALIAVLVTAVTGDPDWDAYGTLAIGVLLITIAVFVAVEVKQLLIGQSADPMVVKEMRVWLAARPEIETVYHLITLQQGSEILVSVKARVRNAGSLDGAIDAINATEVAFKQRFPDVRWSFVEPDNKA